MNNTNKITACSTASCTKTTTSDSSTASANEIINILLLDRSGVGKSTFTNAFVNYLTFGTLAKAEQSEPVVLKPVSFIMTTGDNFDEHIIKFGDSDSSNNENANHSGESVTQHCKSYLFHLKHINEKKIRIIDTSGVGDTQDIYRDDINMQHILEYINDLTHLNAVCFLFKPNA
ncbi:unnamed protein product [Rotaria socialis]|uniref:G domain-containing protein n=1 Tax=Rotaria socialis TaxID=392032 RepID=A0A818SX52_9BILA|nr:unnamed protein product [Rotaria socialis]CAF3341806.1 unnamed protein product [Rotaria socialis]CAF3643119.1 unnamed protein product [Rotaria socialis]CAF3678969.1 unnamed protein product [Rotaria socialis]CAF4178739.1 unnamed protein product [Rotaria socialis]